MSYFSRWGGDDQANTGWGYWPCSLKEYLVKYFRISAFWLTDKRHIEPSATATLSLPSANVARYLVANSWIVRYQLDLST